MKVNNLLEVLGMHKALCSNLFVPKDDDNEVRRMNVTVGTTLSKRPKMRIMDFGKTKFSTSLHRLYCSG
ncbi:hypothetical protein CHARACLAT_019111 [Characodon lateralis]|uniref:Uncharacterized protein n=1 Tax=Characodon lateralis TaxID=208331 RepID=A0ABU7E1S0_9TELE|nr:hypothetical protein [Characodon lateralis]